MFLRRLNSNSTLLLCFSCRTHLLSPLSKLNLSYQFSSSYATVTSFSNDHLYAKEQTLFSIFKKCSTMEELKQVHAHIIQTGFDQSLFVIGKVIIFCAVSELGDMDYAVSVFKKIPNPDGFLWNTMIRGFGKMKNLENVFDYYKKMMENGEKADNFTFCFLSKICGEFESIMLGKQIHCNIMKHGLDFHVFVRNTLIYMYGTFKDIGIARKLFDEIPNSDLIAWNTIIDCHVNCRQYKEALELFTKMLRIGIDPDETTLVVTLSACSSSGELHFGKWVHSCIDNSPFVDIISISNSLIDMYAKCGSLQESIKLFKKMKKRNIVSWNTIILALAMHGQAHESLTFFTKMLEENLERPNDVTFLGVLSACSHGGMVEEGRNYFKTMKTQFNIEPNIKHYGSMVDILSRAGFLKEAYDLIQSMPMKCNAIVWRTLLASCRVHRNVELGEIVRKHLLEIEPNHSSDYVLLANMYASEGNWNKAGSVWRSMQGRGVYKPGPGNSLIDTERRAYSLTRIKK